MAVHPFWTTHCPVRPGPDLTHVHASDCREGHEADQCCECGETARGFEALQARLASLSALPPAISDHEYWPTILGICARPSCRKPMALHQPVVLRSDEIVVEPKMRTGVLRQWSPVLKDYIPGEPTGPGRGALSQAWMDWAKKAEWKS